jgi:PmbA protein
LLNAALEALKKNGAQGDAWLEERRTLRLQVRDGKMEELSRADVRGLAIRAMVDSKLGFVHASATDPAAMGKAAAQAVEIARSGTSRDDLVLAPAAGPGDGSDEGTGLQLYDASIESRSMDEKRDWIASAESAARAFDPRIKRSDGASYTENASAFWIANTNGLFRQVRKTFLEVGVTAVADDAGEMQIGEAGFEVARFDALSDPSALGRKAGERAVRLLGGRPVPTGRYPVVVSPDAGFAPLVYLTSALRGDHLSRGRSWLAKDDGGALGSPLFTVIDDARMPGGPASLPFDAEGVDTGRVVLVDKGKVAGNLRDLAAGKRLGKQSTGASRRGGYEGLPEIQSSNCYLEPGSISRDDLFSGIEKGLWIWGFTGWWIGLDPSNPDFSSAAFGLWIENGKPAQSVARVTVASSLRDMFLGIDAVANDLEWDHATKAPSFRVKEMSVSGT